ncbi:MAG: type II secretion system F family protein [Synergistaceae bacterium]|nr:type II secretion system F family protein [Synergistaceae bacterium]
MQYNYRARQQDGQIVEGIVEADTQKEAVEQLKGRSLMVISLGSQGGKSAAKSSSKGGGKSLLQMDLGDLLPTSNKLSLKTLMVFFRQLATMEGAGLSLATSLDVITSQESNKALKKILTDIKNRLDRGVTLSQAMAQHPAFNQLLVSLVQAGEEGGMLDYSLEQGATLLEKQQQLRSKIRSALFYPAFIMIFAVIILVAFFIFLVPKFQEVFASLSIELPEITLAMFAAGEWFQAHWQIIAAVVIALILLLRFLMSNKQTKRYVDKVELKIPVLKDLLFKAAMARSARTFASLVSAGVTVVRSLEMSEGTAGNVVVQDGFETLRRNAIRGMSLGDSAKQAKIFPTLVSQMMRIGEETGHLDQMLERVATWYDQELDEQIKATVSLLEPFMIVFVGGIIAIIALAIFAPITSAIVQLS